MRLDPKYFNRFVVIVALLAAVLIAIFTFWNQESREQVFSQRLDKQIDSVAYQSLAVINESDSISIGQFKGDWVILDFWATWGPQSRQSHKVLHRFKKRYPDTLQIICAASQDPVNEIQDYIQKHQYPFIFVDGKQIYRNLNPPGVPTQIIFKPDGSVLDIIIGYRDTSQYDQLRASLEGKPL